MILKLKQEDLKKKKKADKEEEYEHKKKTTYSKALHEKSHLMPR